MSYVKKMLQADNLPSWISLIALVAVLITLKGELSRSEIVEEKLKIVKQFTQSPLPIEFEQVKLNPKKLQAMSELVSDKLAVQTARGYEFNRFDPRLKDDIYISIRLALAKHQPDVDKYTFPKSCAKIEVLLVNSELIVMKLERLRGGTVDLEFKSYLNNHRDVFLKQLYYNTDRTPSDYQSALDCFDLKKGI